MTDRPTQLATKVLTRPWFTNSVVFRNSVRRVTIERVFSGNSRAITVKSISENGNRNDFLYFQRNVLSPSFDMARLATTNGKVIPELEDAIEAVGALTWSAMLEEAKVVNPKFEQALPGPEAEEIAKRALRMDTVVRKAHNGLWVRPYIDACVRCWERDKAVVKIKDGGCSCERCMTTYVPDAAAIPDGEEKSFARSMIYQPIPLVTCQCPTCGKPGKVIDTISTGLVRIECEDESCNSLYEAEIPPVFTPLKERTVVRTPEPGQSVTNAAGEFVSIVGAVLRPVKITDSERQAMDLVDPFLFPFIPGPGGRWNVWAGYAENVALPKIIHTREGDAKVFVQKQPGWRAYEGEPGNFRPV